MPSTFAWFSVTAGANTSAAASTSGSLSVDNDPTATSGGAYTVTFTVSWTEDSTYTAATTHLVDNNGAEYVILNGATVPATSASGTHAYGKINVQLTGVSKINDGTADTAWSSATAPQKAAIAGTYKMNVTSNNARVKFFESAPSSNFTTSSHVPEVAITLANDGTVSGNSSVAVFYTINGEGATDNNDGQAGTDNVSFTLSLTAKSYTA